MNATPRPQARPARTPTIWAQAAQIRAARATRQADALARIAETTRAQTAARTVRAARRAAILTERRRAAAAWQARVDAEHAATHTAATPTATNTTTTTGPARRWWPSWPPATTTKALTWGRDPRTARTTTRSSDTAWHLTQAASATTDLQLAQQALDQARTAQARVYHHHAEQVAAEQVAAEPVAAERVVAERVVVMDRAVQAAAAVVAAARDRQAAHLRADVAAAWSARRVYARDLAAHAAAHHQAGLAYVESAVAAGDTWGLKNVLAGHDQAVRTHAIRCARAVAADPDAGWETKFSAATVLDVAGAGAGAHAGAVQAAWTAWVTVRADQVAAERARENQAARQTVHTQACAQIETMLASGDTWGIGAVLTAGGEHLKDHATSRALTALTDPDLDSAHAFAAARVLAAAGADPGVCTHATDTAWTRWHTEHPDHALTGAPPTPTHTAEPTAATTQGETMTPSPTSSQQTPTASSPELDTPADHAARWGVGPVAAAWMDHLTARQLGTIGTDTDFGVNDDDPGYPRPAWKAHLSGATGWWNPPSPNPTSVSDPSGGRIELGRPHLRDLTQTDIHVLAVAAMSLDTAATPAARTPQIDAVLGRWATWDATAHTLLTNPTTTAPTTSEPMSAPDRDAVRALTAHGQALARDIVDALAASTPDVWERDHLLINPATLAVGDTDFTRTPTGVDPTHLTELQARHTRAALTAPATAALTDPPATPAEPTTRVVADASRVAGDDHGWGA